MKPLKLSLALILVGSVLLLSAGSESAESPNPPPSPNKAGKEEKKESGTKKEYTAEYQKPAEQQTFTANLNNAPIDNKGEKNCCNNGSDSSSTNWWIMIFTGCLVLVGAVQAAIYFYQARYTREGLKLTERAANAAEKSADTAESSLKSAERAWLSVHFPSSIRPVPNVSNEISYEIENSGRTIARVKDIMVLAALWEPNKMPTYPFENAPIAEDAPTMSVVPPNKILHLIARLNTVFNEDQVRKIASAELIWDLHGHVIYDDIFNIRHSTRFCYIYNPGFGGFIFPAEAKADYNDAD